MHAILINIGPIFCSVITYLTLNMFLDIKPEWIKKIALFVSCFLVNAMVIFVGDLANMPPTFVIFLLALQWACNGSLRKKLTIGFTLSTAPFAVNCIVDSFFLQNSVWSGLAIGIAEVGFWLVLLFIISRFRIPKDFDLPVKYWNVLLLISCTPFLVLLSIIVIPDIPDPIPSSLEHTLICILMIVALSVLGILYAIAALYKASKLEEQQLLFEVNDQYYNKLESQMYQIRKFRHDLSNHLQVLLNLPETEMKAYIEQLVSDQSIAKPMVFCRDSVINALISSKYDYIQSEGIEFSYEISLEEDHSLSPTDVCALVGNLLDNAIEGCLKLKKNRFIQCDISCSKGLFVIRISNSCMEDIHPDFVTQKKDPAAHGFGIKTIREIVNRKKGTLQITHEKGVFEVFLVI